MSRIISSRLISFKRGSLGLAKNSINVLALNQARGLAFNHSLSLKGNLALFGGRKAAVPLYTAVRSLFGNELSEEALEKKYEDYFNRNEIDGWEVRQAMNDLMGMDLVISPPVIIAGLKACRRVNDIAVAIRWLEGCKEKCADDVDTLWPHILEEIKPTLNELGIPTPEELGWDEPELALKSVFDM